MCGQWKRQTGKAEVTEERSRMRVKNDRKGCQCFPHTWALYLRWSWCHPSSFPTSTFSSLMCSSPTFPSSHCHHCHYHGHPSKYKHTHSVRHQKVEQLLCHKPSGAHTEPLLSITTLSNSRLVTMWLFYLFVCTSVSANLFFMNEEVCVRVCLCLG